MKAVQYPSIEILTDDGDILSYNDPYSGPFERMGEAIDDAAMDGGMVILEDRQYKQDLIDDFLSAVEPFRSGESFDGKVHRLQCLIEAHSRRDVLEAWDMPVMTEDELFTITGDL